MATSPAPVPPLPNRSYQSSPSKSPNLSTSLSSPSGLNEMVSQSAKPSHTCPSCSRPFSRAEHLDRHLTTHLPSNCSKSFVCPSCGKGFTRKDVLTRHVRAVHETKRSDVRRSRRRSCKRCAGFKIKCSGGVKGSADGIRGDEACEACKKRGVMCIYDFGINTDGIADRGEAPGKSPGSGSADGVVDGLSDEIIDCSDREQRTSKKRKMSNLSSDIRHLPPMGNVSHLLSAAFVAGPDSLQQIQGDTESLNAAATVASLVNSSNTSGQRGSDMMSAEQLMSLVTNRTYEEIADKAVSIRSPYTTGDRASSLSRLPTSPPQTSIHTTTDLTHGARSSSPLLRAPLHSSHYFPVLTQPPATSSLQQSLLAESSSPIRPKIELPSDNQCAEDLPDPSVTFANVCMGTSNIIAPFSIGSPKIQPNELIRSGDNRRGEPLGDPMQLESDDNWFSDFETDWLRCMPEFDQLPPGFPLADRHLPSSNTPVTGVVPSLTNSRTGSGSASRELSSPSSTPSEYSAYRSNSKEVRLPSVSPIKDHSAVDDLLPWCWRAEEPRKRITLPPLRQVLEGCSTERLGRGAGAFNSQISSTDSNLMASRIGTVSDHLRNELVEVLKVPYDRHPYFDDCDVERKFPSKELIDEFIMLYFKHFHSILPMIHKPTFEVEKCPNILLVAMASIGASYSDIDGAKGLADGLSELCKRALTWLAEHNTEYFRSEYYLTAFCLQHTYALGSGHQALYDAADSTRSFLVANARRCGLFSDKTSPCTRQSSTPSSPKGNSIHSEDLSYSHGTSSDESLNSRWIAWCEQERRKRVAWAIFSYDSSFSTLSNRRGGISLNDIKARLPCEEKMWEAPSAKAWVATLPPTGTPNASLAYRGMLFVPTLRDVIARKLDPKEIPSWAKELCAWALGRVLWDFREMEQTAQGYGMNGVGGLGLPALTEGLKQTKETALAALTSLGEAAWKNEGGECDKVHSNLTSLIAHYSHLHSGVPTISLILSLARNPPSTPCPSSKTSSETLQDVRTTRLRTIFIEDPVHARTIAWHAGQIIGISRYRPVHTPAEAMRVFLAGVVLWGVAKWFVECRPITTENTWRCIRLDLIPIPSSNPESSYGMPVHVTEWLKTGKGMATIRKDGDGVEACEAQLCSEQGAKDVLQVVINILGKMRIWGLGAEFRRVLEFLGK